MSHPKMTWRCNLRMRHCVFFVKEAGSSSIWRMNLVFSFFSVFNDFKLNTLFFCWRKVKYRSSATANTSNWFARGILFPHHLYQTRPSSLTFLRLFTSFDLPASLSRLADLLSLGSVYIEQVEHETLRPKPQSLPTTLRQINSL